VNRSDSLSSAVQANGNPNLVSVEDLLLTDVTLLDVSCVEDIPVELFFEPDQAQPYLVKVNGEVEEAHTELADARQAFEFQKAEVQENLNARKWGEYLK
jgi:hypothetical protein